MADKILITGASGFLGSWVCRKFLDEDLIAVVSPFSKSKRLDTPEYKRLKIVSLDLTDKSEVVRTFKKYKPRLVIHLGSHGVYQYQQNDYERVVLGNYQMSANLLEASRIMGVERFINTGSVFEYGSQKRKVKEDDTKLTDILNPYSAVKMATTAIANSYAETMDVITLRPFTFYGPGEDPTRFIMGTIMRALANEPIGIVRNVVRDFVYVEDVATAYYLASRKKIISGNVINIASGKKSTLTSTALLIRKIAHSTSRIVIDEKYRRSKESGCWADILKADRVLGWRPRHTLKSGIKLTVESLKK